DICMTFNSSAESLIKHGFARLVDKKEGMDLLQLAYESNLVQFGENVRERVNFICNCCGCCCEAMIAQRRFSALNPIHTTNFLPEIDVNNCTGCGKCVNICPVEAMSLISANDPKKPNRKIATLNTDICLGCGLCVRACPTNTIELVQRDKRVITPLNSVHRVVLMAIERGKLQNLIFDNQVLFSHRALAALFGVIFKLPPAKQLLASKQLRSRYLEKILNRM
ncbi:MAG: (Fe-S)-binding protein, partial [Candidatus Cloacimonas sp. 4484_143]